MTMSVNAFEDPDDVSPILAEIRSEYIAYLIETEIKRLPVPPRKDTIFRRAAYYRLSVDWLGGHGDCVVSLGSRKLSSH